MIGQGVMILQSAPFSSLNNPEQQALAAARLLGELPGKDLTSDSARDWLCLEIARLSGARRVALYWPPSEGFAGEFWVSSQDVIGQTERAQRLINLSRQALELGQVTWIKVAGLQVKDPPAVERVLAEWVGCLPFSGPGKVTGVFVLWTQASELDAQARELLEITGSCLASLRYQASQVSQLREAFTELEQRRAELLHSRNTLRALFDNTPTSMYIISSNHTLLAVNRRRANLAGHKPQRLVGRRCFESLFSRNSPCPDCLVRKSLADRRNTRRTEHRSIPNGSNAILEIATFPVQQDSGQVGQAIIFEEDVTKRRGLEASLVQAEKLAAIGQLAAGVAHEINNPLTAVIANAQLLQRDLADQDGDISEMLSLILQAGERALQVVHQLLDLSRPAETGLTPIDLNNNLRQALSILRHQLQGRSIRLLTDLASNLPVVLADPGQLQSVWINLLANAMDAVQDGQGEIRVSTRWDREMVEVKVADNGTGIPAEHLAQVFEPFYTTKAPGKGTGLGLSISYRVVKEHGGDMQVESQPGFGTSFTVLLPIASPS